MGLRWEGAGAVLLLGIDEEEDGAVEVEPPI